MQDLYIHTLPNGIRIIHKQVLRTQIMHCGIMLDIGSRDEQAHQQGLAHFWEHLAFQGTERRNSFHILNTLERVGGDLNAYTSKEKICFHASVLCQHFEKATELLTDITFRSTFPEKQLEKERNVILEEMSMYHDSPEDAIQDQFDTIIFPEHSLGYNIIGTAESIKSFNKADLQVFINENLDTERIVFSSVGNLPFKKVLQLAKKHLGTIPHKKSQRSRTIPLVYTPQKQEVKRKLSQAQVAFGKRSFDLADQKRLPFAVLMNLLGGSGMNSRFNLSLREKHGLVYAIDASFVPYLDSGYFGVFFGTEPRQVAKATHLALKEIRKLKEKRLGSTQLYDLKQQHIGQLAMAEENNSSFMQIIAKCLLDVERIDTIEEIFGIIESITASQLQDLAHEIFDENQLSFLVYLPEEK